MEVHGAGSTLKKETHQLQVRNVLCIKSGLNKDWKGKFIKFKEDFCSRENIVVCKSRVLER